MPTVNPTTVKNMQAPSIHKLNDGWIAMSFLVREKQPNGDVHVIDMFSGQY